MTYQELYRRYARVNEQLQRGVAPELILDHDELIAQIKQLTEDSKARVGAPK